MSRASRFVWIKIVEWITKGVKFMSRASRFVWIKMPRPIRFACRSASRASRFVWIKICNGQARRGMEAGHELRASCGLKSLHIECGTRCDKRHELRASCGLKFDTLRLGLYPFGHELRASCGLKCLWTDLRKMA